MTTNLGKLLGSAAVGIGLMAALDRWWRRGVDLDETIDVHAPVDRVFALWSHLEGFSRFMRQVRSVHLHRDFPGRSHWRIDGADGKPARFDVELRRLEAGRRIAWWTRAGQPVALRGEVSFAPIDGGTRIRLRMRGGGQLGFDPARMKQLVELRATAPVDAPVARPGDG